MKYSGHRKLLCELLKLSKLNAFILLGYQTNTDAPILVYKFRPERTGFNMYAEYTQPQLTFLALNPLMQLSAGDNPLTLKNPCINRTFPDKHKTNLFKGIVRLI